MPGRSSGATSRARSSARSHGRPLIEQQYSSAQELALPFGRYRTVTFSLRQADEARVIDATLTADFVAGTFAVRAVARGLVA